jgi:predicted lipid-binding transport protein (Tim44 family)
MTRISSLVTALTIAAAFTLCPLLEDLAEAGRLGGGRSFGSRPSYQRSAPSPAPSMQSPGTAASTPGSAVRPGMQPSPAGGRWGGMIGGMLMGGLIGSLLFGGGAGHAGPGLLDLLLLGGGLLLLFRFLKSRRMAAASAGAGEPPAFLRGGEPSAWSGADPTGPLATPPPPEAPSLPPRFDQVEFLEGAKAMYRRLQAAWDQRNLADIRQFTMPEVFAEIERQAAEEPHAGRTEILMLDARLLEVRSLEGRLVASVLYDVMLRESAAEIAKQVRELWHFSREEDRSEAFWVLEGLQQLEK